MNYAARATGLLASIAIVLLVAMLRTGLTQADHRRTERATGIREIAADSDYVRAVYEQPVGTDNDASMRAEQILSRAGKTQDALLLDRFFSYCSVKRFLNSDRDCAGLTVRAAIARAAGLAPSAKWPMDAELEARLMGALSFSLPEEAELRTSTSELSWKNLSYAGPGVLRYAAAADGAYLFLAARNQSSWRITSFSVRLQLQARDSAPVDLTCSSHNPFPFFTSDVLEPQDESIANCKTPDGMSLESLLSAVEQAGHQDALSVWVEELTLVDPRVRVVENGKPPVHHLTAQLAAERNLGAIPRYPSPDPVSQELSSVSCSEAGTCLSTFEASSVFLADFFDHHLPLVPIVAGLLMGISIGGLFRRSFLIVGILAAVIVVCSIGAFAYEFHAIESGKGEKGWALLGMSRLIVLSATAFVLWLPSVFVGTALTRLLWTSASKAESHA